MSKRTPTSDPDIVQYQNGTYYFKRGSKEISLKTKDFREAVRAKRALEPSMSGLLNAPLKMTVADVWPLYHEARKREHEKGKIRIRTLEETEDMMSRLIVPYFGKMRIVKLTSVDWEVYRSKCKVHDMMNVRKVFAHFLKFAKKNGYITDLPILEVDKVKRRKRRILKPNEMRMIWHYSRGSLKLFISMALFMGMRRGEIMTLEWDRVNFEERYLFIPEHISKTKSERYVPLAAAAYDLLIERFAEQNKLQRTTRWVFPHALHADQHQHLQGLMTAWNRVRRKAFGRTRKDRVEDVTFHDLRATCEAWAHKRTDLSSTQLEKFFGSSIDVQRRIYVSFDADDVRGVETSVPMLESPDPA